ncbi:hypothetical protein WDV85_12330 [Pseudokineococcus sp. 5B2Z-1]|uniref:hypothetical protein n=1 Tax=Pseudokineococcus sp. 5B2Z-1 TaxID=3132744 RepID=UPI00309E712C
MPSHPARLLTGAVAALACATTALVGLPASATTATAVPPSVSIVTPRSGPVSGTFDVVLDVTPGDAPPSAVDLRLWWKHEVHRDLGPECAEGCRVVLPVDLDSWQPFVGDRDPLAFYPDRMEVSVTDTAGSTGDDAVTVSQVVHPPSILTVLRTGDWGVRGAQPAEVVVTGTSVDVTAALSTGGRAEVGVVEARLSPRAPSGATAVRRVVVDPVPYGDTVFPGLRGDLSVPVADLAEGWYDLVVRATSPGGAYGPGWRTQVLVRRAPDAAWSGSLELDRGQPPGRTLTVQRLRTDGVVPGVVRVVVRPTSAGAGPALQRDLPFADLRWPVPVGDADRYDVQVDGYAPAPGTYATTWQLLDTRGRPMSEASTATMRVTGDADVRWQAPTGEQALTGLAVPVRATVTAPPGRTVTGCLVEVTSPDRTSGWSSGELCGGSRGGAVATPSFSFTPTSQGLHSVTLYYTLSGGLGRTASTTTTVGSPVRISTTVPDLVHGQRVGAVALVQESRGPGRQPVPLAHAEVRFQVRWAGTTRWLDAGTAVAGADGRASLTVRPGRSGAWRALTRSGGDARDPLVVSREDASVVRAAVSLPSVPPTATAGRAVTVQGTVGPGDAEPKVRVQVVQHGSSAWRDAAVVAPSAGKVSARVVLPSRGRWYVRVVRPATTAVAQGISPNARVEVR